MATRAHPRTTAIAAIGSLTARAGCALLAVVLVCLFYWWMLLEAQRTRLEQAEGQLRLRAAQASETLALQVETLMTGMEYQAHSLAANFLAGQGRAFQLAVDTALATFPAGSATVDLPLTALADSAVEGTETATFSINSSASWIRSPLATSRCRRRCRAPAGSTARDA